VRSWPTSGDPVGCDAPCAGGNDMSRIGKLPVPFPMASRSPRRPHGDGQGPQGRAHSADARGGHDHGVEDGEVVVTRDGDSREERSRHGLVRALIANMVRGGHRRLRQGARTGRCRLPGCGPKGRDLELQVGYSHPVVIEAPEGIEFECPAADSRRGPRDRQGVGRPGRRRHPQGAPPEPYKGKGIKYEGEHVRRKAGKAAGADPDLKPAQQFARGDEPMDPSKKRVARRRRQLRIRKRVRGTAARPRLSVYRSNRTSMPS
jgi:large subunit ribosomal protein L6